MAWVLTFSFPIFFFFFSVSPGWSFSVPEYVWLCFHIWTLTPQSYIQPFSKPEHKLKNNGQDFQSTLEILPYEMLLWDLQHRVSLLLFIFLHCTCNVLNYCVALWQQLLLYKCIRKGNCCLCKCGSSSRSLLRTTVKQHNCCIPEIPVKQKTDLFVCHCTPLFKATGKISLWANAY